jgi:FRG domain
MVIESPTELVAWVERARQMYGPDCWWRGHASSRWKLIPGVFRDGRAKYETQYLLRFAMRASFLDKTSPPLHEEYLWRFYVQHCGLPTRLLDWSTSTLVAAWFACSPSKHQDEDGRLWLIDPFSLNDKCIGKRTIYAYLNALPDDLKALFDMASIESGAKGHVAALNSRTGAPRMLAQSAAFTVHSTISCVADEPCFLRSRI